MAAPYATSVKLLRNGIGVRRFLSSHENYDRSGTSGFLSNAFSMGEVTARRLYLTPIPAATIQENEILKVSEKPFIAAAPAAEGR